LKPPKANPVYIASNISIAKMTIKQTVINTHSGDIDLIMTGMIKNLKSFEKLELTQFVHL